MAKDAYEYASYAYEYASYAYEYASYAYEYASYAYEYASYAYKYASYAHECLVRARCSCAKAYAPLVRVRSRAREGACAVTNTHVQVPHVFTRSNHVSSSLHAYRVPMNARTRTCPTTSNVHSGEETS